MDHRTGTRTETLLLDAFEEAKKGRVLSEEGRNLLEPCAGPVLDPGLRQIVGDVVEAAFAHGQYHRPFRRWVNGPYGSFVGDYRPTFSLPLYAPARAGLPAREPAVREPATDAGRPRRGGGCSRHRDARAPARGGCGGARACGKRRGAGDRGRRRFDRADRRGRDRALPAACRRPLRDSQPLRARHRRRSDTFARVRALALAARRRHPEPIVVDGNPIKARIVLVANNGYELDVFNVGERNGLDEGKLHAYVAEEWWPRTWHERVAETFRIGAPGGEVRAAVDGEPVVLDSPAELHVQPGALRVRVPLQRE